MFGKDLKKVANPVGFPRKKMASPFFWPKAPRGELLIVFWSFGPTVAVSRAGKARGHVHLLELEKSSDPRMKQSRKVLLVSTPKLIPCSWFPWEAFSSRFPEVGEASPLSGNSRVTLFSTMRDKQLSCLFERNSNTASSAFF